LTSHLHQTLVFFPVGIPGMGKTTFGRFLESASQHILLKGSTQVKVNFVRVSYDKVFTQLQTEYVQENPDADQVAAFDIIRPLADARFESQIRDACKSYKSTLTISARKRFASEETLTVSLDHLSIDIIYVDKNNTPDKWEVLTKLMRSIQEEDREESVIQTILLIPK
jgi:hypothetical protein